ncbi:MAG: 4Fe-4S binding protein [Candidatus Methanomethylicia archaeon]|uniref:Ferredoxin n=1 Tax=Thermoproteota archaeon TaxID=2056631 RepID=A0A523BFF5_9CREN|nr:4Fe-4S binding protein [Candidatus Methanomethylicia archaeon]MCQ5374367.1 4Fe-4S binding protein [Candidatus Methanomethylicia archaeon]NHV59948.1 4Fe-4S binding protein [Candidatus Verstraetearchaeota archaeon]TDA39681.1 MAG: ferredoxin [Candidatus Verstraetearchaeota archaeon]
MSRLKGWKEIPIGGTIVEPGSSVEFDVSSWRTFRPVFDKKKCTKCGMCWIFCPEGAIKINDDGTYDVNLSYCKGCGICQKACAVKAITMVKEG